jgi:hypothetical protein
MISIKHIAMTFFELVQIVVSFFLMIAIMVLNFWIMFSIVAGLTVGYFLFRVERTQAKNENSESKCVCGNSR